MLVLIQFFNLISDHLKLFFIVIHWFYFFWQTPTSSTWPSRPSDPPCRTPSHSPSVTSPRSPWPAESRKSTSRCPARSGGRWQSCLPSSCSSWTRRRSTTSQNRSTPVWDGQPRWMRWPPSLHRVSASSTGVPSILSDTCVWYQVLWVILVWYMTLFWFQWLSATS